MAEHQSRVEENVNSLLRQCQGQNYAARMRLLVQIGQTASNPEVQGTINWLLRSPSVYERLLGLQTCYGSQDPLAALKALADPSRHMKNRAIKIVPLLASDTQIVDSFQSVPSKLRASFLRELRSRRRMGVIDNLLDQIRFDCDTSYTRLFPYGSGAYIERRLSEVTDLLGRTDWWRLATFHPKETSETILDWISRTNDFDPNLFRVVNCVLGQLNNSSEFSHRTIAIIEGLLPFKRLIDFDSLQALVNKHPWEMVRLITDSPVYVDVSLGRVYHKLSLEELQGLYRRDARYLNKLSIWYRKTCLLTPSQKASLYLLANKHWREIDGTIKVHIVQQLPLEERDREARRNLALEEALKDAPKERLGYAQCLPWDEAVKIISPYLQSKDSSIRGEALVAYIQATQYNREQLTEALKLVIQHVNEHNIVRHTMIYALAYLPLRIWKEDHLQLVKAIVVRERDSIDRSTGTLAAVRILLENIFRVFPTWAVEQLISMVRSHSTLAFRLSMPICNLHEQRDAAFKYLDRILVPVLDEWYTRREIFRVVLLTTTHLREHLGRMPDLLDYLERILPNLRNDDNIGTKGYADSVLGVLKRFRPDRIRNLIPELLALDESWIKIHTVQRYLHLKRQDLLNQYLVYSPHPGLHNPDGRSEIIFFKDSGHFRWEANQQKIYAHTLLTALKKEPQSVEFSTQCIDQLAKLGFVDGAAEALISFAQLEQPKKVFREKALQVLGWLDQGKGIDTLLEALNDDRARVAIYALATALRSMTPELALEALKNSPLKKATVSKQIVRLIGDLKTEDSYQYLLQFEQRQDLHEDVRIPLLRCFWTSYPSREEGWTVLEHAARSRNEDIAMAISELPPPDSLGPRSADWPAYLRLLYILMAHPAEKIRIAALRRVAQCSLQDRDAENILPDRIAELANPDRASSRDQILAASMALFKHYLTSVSLVAGLFAQLMPQQHRRLLREVVEELLSSTSKETIEANRWPLTFRAILTNLKKDPLLTSVVIKITFRRLPAANGELRAAIFEILDNPALHGEALLLACEEIEKLDCRSLRLQGFEIETIERALRNRADAHGRRLGVSALTKSIMERRRSVQEAWTDQMKSYLQDYRRDPNYIVAEAASWVLLPEEGEEPPIIEDSDDDDWI